MAMTLDAVLRIVARAETGALGAVQRGISGIKSAADQANTSLGAIRGAIGGLTGGIAALGVGLSAAGLAAFAKQGIDAADNLRDLSLTTGVSVESLSKFQQAANMSGSSVEDVGKAMVRLQRNMVEAAATGKGAAAEAFRDMGVSAVDANGKMRPVEQVMLDIFEALSKVPDPAVRTSLAVDAMGRSAAGLVPMMEGGRAAIEGLTASVSTEFAGRADAYNDAIATMGVVMTTLGNVMVNDLLPPLTETILAIARLGVVLRDVFIANRDAIVFSVKLIGESFIRGLLGPLQLLEPLVPKVFQRFAGDGSKAAAEVDRMRKLLEGVRISMNALDEPGKKATGNQKALREEQERAREVQKAIREQQEAFTFAIERSRAQYAMLSAVIDTTSQQLQGQNRLRDATLTADIAINNSAKAVLEVKLAQAKTDQQRIPILQQIQAIDLENARLQRVAAAEQIAAEVEIARLKVIKAQREVDAAQAALRTAQAYRQQTAALQEQLGLKKLNAQSAQLEYGLQQQIAQQRQRANNATFAAQQTEILGRIMPGSNNGLLPGQWIQPGSGFLMGPQAPQFAAGGYVTRPTLGLIGEGGESEYVIPASRMAAASTSYLAGARGAAVLAGRGGSDGPVNVSIQTGPVMQSGGQEWVSKGDLSRAVTEAVRQTKRALLNPGVRADLGMG